MLERANEGRGIALDGSTGNTIGGPQPGGNLIAGNRATGVRLLGASDNNIVQNNFMGVNRNASAFIANDRGVQIRGSAGNQILGNLIMGHTYDGIHNLAALVQQHDREQHRRVQRTGSGRRPERSRVQQGSW